MINEAACVSQFSGNETVVKFWDDQFEIICWQTVKTHFLFKPLTSKITVDSVYALLKIRKIT